MTPTFVSSLLFLRFFTKAEQTGCSVGTIIHLSRYNSRSPTKAEGSFQNDKAETKDRTRKTNGSVQLRDLYFDTLLFYENVLMLCCPCLSFGEKREGRQRKNRNRHKSTYKRRQTLLAPCHINRMGAL